MAFIVALCVMDVLQAWIELILKCISLGEAIGLFYQIVVVLIMVIFSVIVIVFLSKWQEKND